MRKPGFRCLEGAGKDSISSEEKRERGGYVLGLAAELGTSALEERVWAGGRKELKGVPRAVNWAPPASLKGTGTESNSILISFRPLICL